MLLSPTILTLYVDTYNKKAPHFFGAAGKSAKHMVIQ
jgi:hypothetical protein